MQILTGVPKSSLKRFRPRVLLSEAEDCAVSIRKTLCEIPRVTLDATTSRVRGDVVKTCNQIERLCRRGCAAAAEEAIDYFELVEIHIAILERQLMDFLASRCKHVTG